MNTTQETKRIIRTPHASVKRRDDVTAYRLKDSIREGRKHVVVTDDLLNGTIQFVYDVAEPLVAIRARYIGNAAFDAVVPVATFLKQAFDPHQFSSIGGSYDLIEQGECSFDRHGRTASTAHALDCDVYSTWLLDRQLDVITSFGRGDEIRLDSVWTSENGRDWTERVLKGWNGKSRLYPKGGAK